MADGFLIPNRPDTGYSADQAEPDKGDFQALGFQKSGVLSGGAVTRSNTFEVSVTETKGWLNGNFFTAAAATKTMSGPSSGTSKFVLIVARYNSGSYTIETIQGNTGNFGESATNTRYPDTFDPDTEVLLAAIYMDIGASDISASSIVDKRVMVLPQANPTSVTSTPTASDGNIGEIRINTNQGTLANGQSDVWIKRSSTDPGAWANLGTYSATANTSTEEVQDIVGAMLVTNGTHNGVSATYDDAGDGAIDLTVTALSWNLITGGQTATINSQDTVNLQVGSNSNYTISHDGNGTVTLTEVFPYTRTVYSGTSSKQAGYLVSDPFANWLSFTTEQFMYHRLITTQLLPTQDGLYQIGAPQGHSMGGFSGSNARRYSYLHLSHTAYANSVALTSDERLKQNWGDSPGLNFIRSLQPKSFEFIEAPGIVRWGFSAQAVEKACDDHGISKSLVTTDSNTEAGHKFIDYTSLVGPLTRALQELDARFSSVEISEGLTVSNLEEQIAGSKTQSQSAVDYIADFDAKMLAKQPQVDQDRADIADLKTRVAALEAAASG